MNKTTRLIILIAILIIILGFFNWKLYSIETGFKKYCGGHYNVSVTCPCTPSVAEPKQNNFRVDLTDMNLTK